MTHCQGRLIAQVLFIEPAGTKADWVETDLWRSAAAMPGVTVHRDEAGIEARRFGCETSGQALLYGREGRLMFQGGITSARGHAGDNIGRSAVEALLFQGQARQTQTPVFGCPLFAPTDEKGTAECKK